MSFSVYTITNIVTGQIYVGKTNDPVRRWRTHCYFSKRKLAYRSHLYNNMNHYGSQNFKFEIIHTVVHEQEAYQLERRVISQLSLQGIKLLNNTLGGDGNRMTQVQKNVASLRMKALWKTSAFREKMLRRRVRRGHRLTNKTRQAISESLKRKWKSDPSSQDRINTHIELLRTSEYRRKAAEKQRIVQQRPEVKEKIALARFRRNEHMREKVNAVLDEYVPYVVSYAILAKKYGLTVTQVKGIVKNKLYAYLVNKT